MGSDVPTNFTYPHGTVTISPTQREICGSNAERQDFIIGPNAATKFASYFCARFDAPMRAWGTASNADGALSPSIASAEGKQLSGYALFAEGTRVVNARVGVSFISVDQARKNLDTEIPDGQTLEETARQTRAAWADKLDRVKVEGGGDEIKTVFYTGIFHTLQVRFPMIGKFTGIKISWI